MSRDQRWLALRLRLPVGDGAEALPAPERISLAAQALAGLGCLGLEELGDFGRDAEADSARAYLPAEASVDAAREALHAAGLSSVAIEAVEHLEDGDWVEVWESSLAPLDLGRRLTVVPRDGVEEGIDLGGRLALHLEPGRAFGTGRHESTRLAARWVEEVLAPGASVLDVGTGSGILAAAAARLGAAAVLGTDVDPVAIEVARATIERLPERDVVTLRVLDGVAALESRYDVVVANLTSDVLLPMLDDLLGVVAVGGHLVLSGVLGVEAERFEQALAATAWRAEWHSEGEWTACCVGVARS